MSDLHRDRRFLRFLRSICAKTAYARCAIVATISARKNKRNIRGRHLPNASNAERLLARYLSSLRQFSHKPKTSSV